MNLRKTIDLKLQVPGTGPIEASDFFANASGLSKALVKKVMVAGGAWWQRQSKGRINRVRKATFEFQPGDHAEFYYNPDLSWLTPEEHCFALWESPTWGVWYKGPGILSEGTRYGDQGSILRMLEKIKKEVFLVHRLDRETAGLLVLTYNKSLCAFFSEQWSKPMVQKFYLARVVGNVQELKVGKIEIALEGKEAITEILKIEVIGNEALVHINLHTGRYHQIRQHLNMLGCPIKGDPRYGEGNKNQTGLELLAFELRLPDPRSKTQRVFRLPDENWPQWAKSTSVA